MNTFSSLVSNTNLLSRLFNNLENNPAKNLQINNCIKLSANILQNQKALSNPIKFNALGTKIFPEIIENNTINNNIFPINIPDLENTNIDVASIFDNILSNISIENKSIANMPKVPVNDNITNDLSMASIPVKKINVEKKLGIAKNKIKEIINAISLENPIGFIAKNAEKINIIIDDNIPKITSENIANILNNIDEIILPTFEPQIIENKSIKENIIAKKINKIKNINKYDTPIIHILQPIAIPQHIAMADKISLMENNNIADNNINFEPIIQTNKQINSEIKLDNKIEKYISLKNKIDTDINLENHSENIAESIYKNKPKNVIKNIVQKESQAIEIKDVTNLENKKYPKIISPINSNNETLKDADIDKFVKYIARKINTQDINLTSPRNINIQAIKSTHIIEKNNIIDIPQDNNIEKLNIFINQLDMNISIDINNNNEHYIIAKDFIAKIPVFINTYDEININIVDVNSINKKEKKYPPQNIPLILNNNQNNIKDLTGIPAKIEINIHSNPLKNQIISPKKIKDKQWNPPNIINEISQIKNTEIDEDLDIVPFKYENFTPNFVVHSKTDNILKKELVIKDMPVDVKTKPVVMREIKEVVEKDTLIADIPVDVKTKPVVIPEIKEVVEKDTLIADMPVDIKSKPVVIPEIKEVVENDTFIADIPVDVKTKPVVMSEIKEVVEKDTLIADIPVDVKEKPVVMSGIKEVIENKVVIKDMPVDVKAKPVVIPEIKEVVEKDTLIADIPVDVKAEPVVIPEIKEVVENDTLIADMPVDIKAKPVVIPEIKEVVEKDTLIADIPVDIKAKPVVMREIKEVVEKDTLIADIPVDIKSKPVVIPEIKEVVEKDTLIADILVDVKEKPVEVKLKPVVPLEIKEVIENKPVIINEVVNDNIHIVNNNTQFAKNNDQKEDRQDDKNEEYSPKKVETNHNPANFAINNPTPSVVPQTVVQKPISQVFNSVRPNELPKIVTNFAGKIPFQSSGIAKIILNPEQLGTLFVEVNLMGEKPIITFKANNQVAVEVLTNNIENLKEMLGGAQIREPEFKFERFIVENGKLSSENKIENNSNSPEQNNFNKQNENGNHSQQQHQRNDNSRDNGQNGRNNFSNYFDIENGINVADEAVEIPKSEVRYRNNNSLVEEYI